MKSNIRPGVHVRCLSVALESLVAVARTRKKKLIACTMHVCLHFIMQDVDTNHMDENGPKKYRKGAAVSEVADELRRQILTLELRPGAALDETKLSKAFSVSRSPIREALNRLNAERLAVTLPNRGTVVAPIDLQQFPNFIAALDVQQRFATRLAARHRSSADVINLRYWADRYDRSVIAFVPIDILQCNYEFHLTVGRATQNPYVFRQYQELLSEARRLLHIHIEYLIETDQRDLLHDQHHGFVDAIEARDVEAADRLAHEHSMQFHDRFLKAMHYVPDAEFAIELEPLRTR